MQKDELSNAGKVSLMFGFQIYEISQDLGTKINANGVEKYILIIHISYTARIQNENNKLEYTKGMRGGKLE